MKTTSPSLAAPPATRNPAPAYALSLGAALLMAIASIAGLVAPAFFYATEAAQHSFVANDLANLVIGLPILLGSMAVARRGRPGRLLGLLFWPGALFYNVYNYLVYALGLPFGWLSAFYLALVALNAWALVRLLAGIDAGDVGRRLGGVLPEKLVGGVLVGLGAAFGLRAVGMLAESFADQAALPGPEAALLLADSLLAVAWVYGGVLLWRRRPAGYVLGAGLLFQAVALFAGVILVVAVRPLLTPSPFAWDEVIVLTVMGMVCFVPFALFLRRAAQARH